MLNEIEHRAVELRAESGGVITGVLIPYDRASVIAGRFTEIWKAGSIGEIGEIRANVQHSRGRALAVNKPGGGLSFENTTTELRARVELPDTSEGRDVRVLVGRGVLSGLSAEFKATQDAWVGTQRTILSAELRGVGIVDTPAHDKALIEIEARYAESEHRGAALVELLESHLPDEGDTERPARIAELAAAGGIEPGTVEQILSGSINAPPAARLRGFADSLEGVSYDALVAAVVADGANPEIYRATSQRRRVWL